MSETRSNEVSLRPFDARMLDVGDGHWLYVEEVGRRDGVPCIFLHGGPGSGAQHMHRRLFNPEQHYVILYDQRGAGRSHPYLSLAANTTDHLIADIEKIRQHFAIDQWLVVGGSWGSTLAIAYAQQHQERVSGLVLRAVFLASRAETEWAFVTGPQIFWPELYRAFADYIDEAERGDVLGAYVRRLTHSDPAIHRPAAQIWHAYERALSELVPSKVEISADYSQDNPMPPTPIVEAQYIAHDFFLRPNQLLDGAPRLRSIPGAIIQGRYDLLCPPKAAYDLSQRWGNCELQIAEGVGHAMTEAGVMDAMRQAIMRLTKR
ncbi:MAG TPA: prolyl aminopeptidase [Candidatus Obscuribacterales bacterium]|nr:prolyl aminopeptidase [Candidatus Obscuribacterales bacterium]